MPGGAAPRLGPATEARQAAWQNNGNSPSSRGVGGTAGTGWSQTEHYFSINKLFFDPHQVFQKSNRFSVVYLLAVTCSTMPFFVCTPGTQQTQGAGWTASVARCGVSLDALLFLTDLKCLKVLYMQSSSARGGLSCISYTQTWPQNPRSLLGILLQTLC
jgi:hypothetical protein